MTDEWLLAASTDDNLVADLLLRLKDYSDLQPPSFPRPALLHWGNRFPRSKNVSFHGNKDRESTRRSPTTPLSWGVGSAASPEHSCEDTSRSFSALRSKGNAVNETTTSTTGVKRPRKKKTFAELKEEESSLIKDRTHLKKELDTLRIKLEEQRSLNQKLKKAKLDLHPRLNMKKSEKETSTAKVCFVLPDLNMDPEDETIERS